MTNSCAGMQNVEARAKESGCRESRSVLPESGPTGLAAVEPEDEM
jgi:hypothetical protein